jgi:hypothetical protein
MERGRFVLEDDAQALLENPDVRAIYFGQQRAAGLNRGLERT